MTDPMPAVRSILGMPPEPVDHKTAARDHIEWAHEQQAADGTYDRTVSDNATLALAEATLALVGQQRVANLIAWEALTGESSRAEVRKGLFS